MSSLPATSLLVVDDDPAIRKLLERIARRAGFAVDTAADGLQALEKIQRNRYDIAIIDLMMPRLSGYELVQKIGEMDARPCLIVASATTETNIKSLDDSLVRTVIRKPFDIEAVAKALIETAEAVKAQQSGATTTIPIAAPPPGVDIQVSDECAPPEKKEEDDKEKRTP